MIADEERVYRFSPLDRAGWILGLGAAECLSLGGALFGAGAVLQVDGPPLLALLLPVAGGIFAFGSWDGVRFHAWTPLLLRHGVARLTRTNRWTRSLGRTRSPQPAWPRLLDGIELIDAGTVALPAGPAPFGAVVDRRARTLSASIAVRGEAFSLIERAEQERLVGLWGEVLAGFCSERGAVSSVRVTEWAAPAGVGAHERFLAERSPDTAREEARAAYAALLADVRSQTVGHEVLVTVTIDRRRLRGSRRGGDVNEHAAERALSDEIRLLAARLDAAQLDVGLPLSVSDLVIALRRRLDPSGFGCNGGTLAEAIGVVSVANAGPMATETHWSHLQVDGSLHRTYWVAEWPRLDVPPSWFEPLVLHAGGVRTVAIHYEPTPPSRARRRIDRDSTRLAADEAQRSRAGFRVGAGHRRAQAAVLERESELVAGYAELEFVGFVTVSANDRDELDRSCAEYEQAAAQAGLEIRGLDARHDLGFVCSLPMGRGLASRRFGQ